VALLPRPLLAAVLLSASASCRPAEAPEPPRARVTLTDLTIRPTRGDGTPWDGPGPGITAEDAAALTRALGASDPVHEVTALLAGPTFQALAKPDVKGRATLFIHAVAQASRSFRGQQDSLTPTLSPRPTWDSVLLDGSVRIEVEVIDEDLAFDDPIGTFVVDAEALATAARRGVVHQLNVGDQTRGAVLFVGLMVVREE
jgi:hypothetical protein